MRKSSRNLSFLAAACASILLFSACDDEGTKPVDDKNPWPTGVNCDDKGRVLEYKETDLKEIIRDLMCFNKVSDYMSVEKLAASPQKVGDPCFCYSSKCVEAGYERPEQATIYGCDNVPGEHQGAKRVCLRSSNPSAIKPLIYFTNGECSLMMARCTGRTTNAQKSICSFAAIGDATQYDSYTSCPNEDEVLVGFKLEVEAIRERADLDVKVCVPSCNTDADCRNTEKDITFKMETSQRKCVQDAETSAKFCFDLRNAPDGVKVISK